MKPVSIYKPVSIEQAIQILLLTDRGERPMLPQFGGGLRGVCADVRRHAAAAPGPA